MRLLLALLLLTAAAPCLADDLPVKPEPTVTVPVYYANSHQIERITLPVPHKTMDDAYVQWNAAMFMVSAADSTLTLGHRNLEVNPLIRHHPVPMTIAGFGLDGLALWLDHKWKREDDAMRAAGIPYDKHDVKWWYVPAMVTVIRGVGLVSDVVAIR